MALLNFSDWVLVRESSPATRLRTAAAKGLMPPIPAASIDSHSTAPPSERKALLRKGRKKKVGRKTKQ